MVGDRDVPPGLEVAPVDGTFASFSGVLALLRTVRPVVSSEAPALLPETERIIADLSRVAEGKDLSRSGAIVFAVIRRISRESHHSALLIDRVARLFLRVMACPSLQDAVLVVRRLDLWDRPSLRALCRIEALRDGHDFRVVGLLDALPTQASGERPFVTRLVNARAAFFDMLLDRLRPHVVGSSGPWAWPAPSDRLDARDGLFILANELGYQNYERVYAVAEQLLKRTDPAGASTAADVWRLVAIADTNLGWLDLADRTLRHARSLAVTPTLPPFLEYLTGLVWTKRMYDLPRAEEHFRHGLSLVQAIGAEGPERSLEEAWLYNGLALVRSLEAKKDRQRAEALLREAFDLEMKAYQLVAREQGPAFSYLRHNLLANITFLLEISGRLTEAVRFWRRSFERYLAADSPAFDVAFYYRLGLLLCKAGEGREGIGALRHALELTRKLGDVFYQDRVAYALAWALLREQRAREALGCFLEGRTLARRLCLGDSEANHLAGAVASAVAAGQTDMVPRLLEAAGNPDADEVRPPPPSPKLPAYIPAVDLEGTPALDINRYLVSGR